MKIFPAIDLYQKKAVRLLRGDYQQMTVYSDHPVQVADDFFRCGASYLHVVDLEGARDGSTANIDVVEQIAETGRLHVEIGGGIRSMQTISDYLQAGVFRVILGTAALQQQGFVRQAIREFGAQHIVVGVDMKDGFVAVHGWTEVSQQRGMDFCLQLQQDGVQTIICTDISKDGAMQGTNFELYRQLSASLEMDIVASGGISTLQDIETLRQMNLSGAILGKALYTGAIDLKQAIAAGE